MFISLTLKLVCASQELCVLIFKLSDEHFTESFFYRLKKLKLETEEKKCLTNSQMHSRALQVL